jgi:hypothetical protein
MTVPFTTVNSSSALISLRLASRGGTPTPTTTTTTRTIIPNYDYGPAYDYQYWNDLAVTVQSELGQRGYYRARLTG